MAHFAGIKCDVCTNIKGSVNHWWIVKFINKALTYTVYPWEDSNATDESTLMNTFHLCGIECKNKKINELDGKIINAINDARAEKIEEMKTFVKITKSPEGF